MTSSLFASRAREMVLNPGGGMGIDLSRSADEKRQRDYLFKNYPQVKEWKQKKQETFYRDLKQDSLSALTEKYPELKKEDLKELQEKRK